MIELNIQLKGFDKALRFTDPKIVHKAGLRTMRDTVKAGRTAASKSIREVFNLKAEVVNKELRALQVVPTGDLFGVIEAKGRPINLIKFGARWDRGRRVVTGDKTYTTKRSTGKSGVSVRIHKGKSTVLKGAFIARGRRGSVDGAGGLFVFQRATSRQYPLVNKASITIASMLIQKRTLEDTGKAIESRWNSRFQHHLDRLRG